MIHFGIITTGGRYDEYIYVLVWRMYTTHIYRLIVVVNTTYDVMIIHKRSKKDM